MAALVGGGALLVTMAAPASAEVRDICFPVFEPVRYIDDFGAPRTGHTHEGNDLIGQKGFRLLAAADATIVDIRGPGTGDSAAGYSVRIRDDQGWYFAYLHVNNDTPGTDDGLATWEHSFAPGLKVGTRVKAGQLLGFMGDSGNAESTSPHLHFEMRQPASSVWQAVPVSPYESLQAARFCADAPFGQRPSSYLGGATESDPDAAAWGPNHLDVFVRGTDDGLWQKAWLGTGWSNWYSVGGVLRSGPASVSSAPGRIDVFVRGTDDALWQRSFANGAWSDWTSLGGILVSDPDAASRGPGKLSIVVRGIDDALWLREFDGTAWSSWTSLGGILTSGPAIAAGGANRLEVFGVGNDSGVWNQSLVDGQWGGWVGLGGVVTSDPDASWSGSSFDVIVRGDDDRLWHRQLTGTWSTWNLASAGKTGGGPTITSWGGGRSDVFVTAADHSLHQSWFTGAW